MEILNGFPAPSDEALVVITVLTPASSRGLAGHADLIWVSQSQLLLAEKGRFPLKELIGGSSRTVVLRNLLVTPEKHLRNLEFLESCGAKTVYVASEPEDLQELWPSASPDRIWPERTVKMNFRPGRFGSKAMALVVGFEESEFSKAAQELPLVRFVWKSPGYEFDGWLRRVREVFINPKLDRAAIHGLKKTLVQGGVGELSISHQNNPVALEALLRAEYSGHGLTNASSAGEKTLTVIISNTPADGMWPQKDVMWWSKYNDHWDEIPRSAARFLVSLELHRFERFELEQVAIARGIKFYSYATREKLVRLLDCLGTTACGKPDPFPPPAIQPAVHEEKPAGPKLSETEAASKGEVEMPRKKTEENTQSSIIRENLHLGYDELVSLVQRAYPDAKRNNILSIRHQIAKKQASGAAAKPAPKPEPAAAAPEPESGQKEGSAGQDILAALEKAAQLCAEAEKLVAAALQEAAEMQARLKRLQPLENLFNQMVSAAKQ